MGARLVTYVDTVDGIALFVTPSWSGKIDESTGQTEVYEIEVDTKEWKVRCCCFGANRWRKIGDAKDPSKSRPCKHIRVVLDMIERHLGQ